MNAQACGWSAAIEHLQQMQEQLQKAVQDPMAQGNLEWWKLIPLLACMERNPTLKRLYPSFNNAIVRLSTQECAGFCFSEAHIAGTFPIWCRYLPGEDTYLVTRAQKRDDFGWDSTELFRGDCIAAAEFVADQLRATDYGTDGLTY